MINAVKSPKKLIEVALPLDIINVASTREKSIRHGHPSSLHLWWARRPLAAARAVLFSQLVNDPGYERELGRGVNKEKAEAERQRLFGIMQRLVQWENSNDQKVIDEARKEILSSWIEVCELNRNHPDASTLFDPKKIPAFHDPFAGGGAIPLEAQRLGLEAYASDLNPVAVMINKAMIEVPRRFADWSPVGPIPNVATQISFKSSGENRNVIQEDVRRWGEWLRDSAMEKLNDLYPKIEVTDLLIKDRPDLKPLKGEKLTVIAWIWARTVRSPNPAFAHVYVPLASTFTLCSKAKREAYVEPIIDGDKFKFVVRLGKTPRPLQDGTVNRKGATCLISGAPMPFKYLRSEAKNGNFKFKMMAIIAEGPKGRVYLSPDESQQNVAGSVDQVRFTETPICHWPGRTNVVEYGMTKFLDLFSNRQLKMLSTFSDLIVEAKSRIRQAAIDAGYPDDGVEFDDGGKGATAYADAISIYLAFLVDQLANHSSNVCGWNSANSQMRSVFARQAIPMVWDFAESNPFCDSSGSFNNLFERQIKAFHALRLDVDGHAFQDDAAKTKVSLNKVLSTDPPYYDNIEYADLSDFFYIWLKKTLGTSFAKVFNDPAVPKSEELVANPYRHGGKTKAEQFFLAGMSEAIKSLATNSHPAFPVTIYYAFKQAETKDGLGKVSTGWESFLGAVIGAGFTITGTWPMRTEKEGRVIGNDSNALASSIVLVCRKRSKDAISISRREFIRELNSALPQALSEITSGGARSPIAPVDLSQAIIGPGMGVFSKYSAVLEADGSAMSIRTALNLINRFLTQDDFDSDTQFCLQWFEMNGWERGKYGDADILARAKGTSIEGLKDAGIVHSTGGNVRLTKPSELSNEWKPPEDGRMSVWELLHNLVAKFATDGSVGAGEILARANQLTESIRTLSYRLYTFCESKGWSQDANSYDGLVRAWDSIETAARSVGYTGTQISLFGSEDGEGKAQTTGKKKRKSK
jgi:putative DNA methylase